MQCIFGDRINAPGCRSIQLSCVRSDMLQPICIYPPCYIRVAISALRRGWGGDAACILRGRVNARDVLLFRREDRLCKGRKATCRTRRSHMHFGSPPKCTWLCFLLAANARVCCSVEARRGCVRPEEQPPCILAERLNARGLRLPFLAGRMRRRSSWTVPFTASDEGSGKVLCIFRGCLNARALPLIFQAVSPLQFWANRVFLL